jgi:hypothetical protein
VCAPHLQGAFVEEPASACLVMQRGASIAHGTRPTLQPDGVRQLVSIRF